MRIVALDFETANNASQSACALGIAIYEDGEFVDNFEWYLKPHHRYNYFTNTNIHGISKEDVENEKEFVYYYEELCDICKDAVLIAHNAMFDINVLNSVCDIYGLEHLNNKFIDSVTLSRKAYPELYNHKLNTVSEYLHIDLSHHNGKSDANACLMILLSIMELYNCYDLDELLNKMCIHYKENN